MNYEYNVKRNQWKSNEQLKMVSLLDFLLANKLSVLHFFQYLTKVNNIKTIIIDII